MKALLVHAWGEPTDLTLTELPDLHAGDGEVVIDVEAVGVNLADILMVQGKYQLKPPFPFAPGSEVAGVVCEVGRGVTRFRPGQRVLASVAHGAYATQVRAPASQVFTIPDVMPFTEAAAFTVVYQTSYFAFVYRAPVRASDTVLVHGAAGGVGVSAVQIAKALGARVLATAGSAEKREFVRSLGADAVFDSRDPGWVEQVLAATEGRGADHVYDPVGGELFERSLKCIAFGGSLHVIGFASGSIPSCTMNRVMLKNISLVGLHWPAYREKDPGKISEAMAALLAMYERGQLAVQVGATYPLREAAVALGDIASRRAQGKIVLTG